LPGAGLHQASRLRDARDSLLPASVVNPEHAEELLTKCQKYAKDRWEASRSSDYKVSTDHDQAHPIGNDDGLLREHPVRCQNRPSLQLGQLRPDLYEYGGLFFGQIKTDSFSY
jgi:hypothetical protein